MTSTEFPTVDTVLRDALSLSPGEQSELLRRLSELTAASDGYEAAWTAEIEARLAAVDSGDERPLEWRGAAALFEDEGRPPSR